MRKREGERIDPFTSHSPCDSQGWTRPDLTVRNSTRVSYIGGRNPTTWALTWCCLPFQVHWQESGAEAERGGLVSGIAMCGAGALSSVYKSLCWNSHPLNISFHSIFHRLFGVPVCERQRSLSSGDDNQVIVINQFQSQSHIFSSLPAEV